LPEKILDRISDTVSRTVEQATKKAIDEIGKRTDGAR
jgi:hypothetical protein